MGLYILVFPSSFSSTPRYPLCHSYKRSCVTLSARDLSFTTLRVVRVYTCCRLLSESLENSRLSYPLFVQHLFIYLTAVVISHITVAVEICEGSLNSSFFLWSPEKSVLSLWRINKLHFFFFLLLARFPDGPHLNTAPVFKSLIIVITCVECNGGSSGSRLEGVVWGSDAERSQLREEMRYLGDIWHLRSVGIYREKSAVRIFFGTPLSVY